MTLQQQEMPIHNLDYFVIKLLNYLLGITSANFLKRDISNLLESVTAVSSISHLILKLILL